ncbi:DNA polymerase IV [Hoyosella subflava]|uniref:DNA polymerase IV n=1 Tax=Hoyosella subflava (strain DSM 45089 / JCM 17490 / NBRC 109087 / DQS3-9A1) TaxID=443218 RepID=F6EQ09_HOYSD|nr:DNA polymerase IV [Hoyosella subflava]AEF41830.1 DNA polymerase IV [Hoyosella subflava DQS3-9A1]
MNYWIMHVDLDQFLAAVEKRRDPLLRDVPVIVGGEGDPERPRQVVACASYEARAYGVRAGMPLRTAAKKCPDAVFLPSDTATYEDASVEVMGTMRDMGLPVEVLGWDEAFVGAESDDPLALAEQIRQTIAERTQLASSIGVGDNKLRAKVATGFAKPAGVYQLTVDNWMAVMGNRSTESLWGIGRKTSQKLAEAGLVTVAELAAADRFELASRFGPTTGPWLVALGRGLGGREIVTQPAPARSHSHSRTFPQDLTDRADIAVRTAELARSAGEAALAEDRRIIRVGVTVRTSTFYTRTHARKLPQPTRDLGEVEKAALAVLDLFPLDRPVRLLGVRAEME